MYTGSLPVATLVNRTLGKVMNSLCEIIPTPLARPLLLGEEQVSLCKR